jgi:hypothetical protein
MAGVAMDAEGCVIAGKMLSGNTSDQTWNADGVKPLEADFLEDFFKRTNVVSPIRRWSFLKPLNAFARQGDALARSIIGPLQPVRRVKGTGLG